MPLATISNSKIHKWGNNQAVTLSKPILRQLNWQDNENVIVRYSNNQIIIERAQSLIEKLFADYKGTEYKSSEMDWGEDVGGERF